MAWAFVAGGADDLVTLRENRAAFPRWALRQRVLTGTRTPRLERSVPGADLPFPILLAPTGLIGLAHWTGELGIARAAERMGTRLVVSSAATYSLEEIASGSSSAGHWFQLYPWGDRELSASLVDRAERAGYSTMVVTVDAPIAGNREGERLHGLGLPPTMRPRQMVEAALHPRWTYRLLRHRRVSLRNLVEGQGFKAGVRSAAEHVRLINEPMDWDGLDWLRQRWRGPLYVKGILDPDDAERAVEAGADGVIVSNHGGRQLDGALASLHALPEIADRVGKRAAVLLDGGIARGSDVVKAMCLGADACLIGRAAVYGLAVAGEDGAADVLAILRAELERTLILMGCDGVDDLDRSWILPAIPPVLQSSGVGEPT
jgi:L-lactate dehydrogenase (cytochrome)/(S)-mandelate dehydrogenase